MAEIEDRDHIPETVDYQKEFDSQMDANSQLHKTWFRDEHYLDENVRARPYGEVVNDSSDEEINSKKAQKNGSSKIDEENLPKKKQPAAVLGDEPEEEV